MTWHGREAEDWMQALDEDGDTRNSGSSVPELSPEEEVRVRRLAQMIEADAPKETNVRPLVWGGAAVAIAAGALLMLSSKDSVPVTSPGALAHAQGSGAAALERNGTRSTIKADTELRSGDRVHTSGPVQLDFSEGAQAKLGGNSSVELIRGASTEGVRLQQGRVDLQIPKQPAGQTWQVSTGTATVTVIGTQFAVWLADDGGAQVTCVSVTEGRVRAESSAHSELLTAGMTWTSAPSSKACGHEAKDAPSVEAAPKDAGDSTLPQVSNAKRPAESTLAEQNRLFLKLVQARRSGNQTEAKSLARKFLSQHPRSPLADQVRAEMAKAD